MKSFEKAIENLTSGSVITIKKNQLVYDGYMLKYDGNLYWINFQTLKIN